MAFRIGINGFGRIGRCVLRAGIERDDIEFVGINDLTSAENLAYLLKYDTVHRTFPGEVRVDGDGLVVNGKRIPISAERDPSKLGWDKLGADMVFECTGIFTTQESAGQHLTAGAKWVMISAPSKGDVDYTVCYGVNHDGLDPETHKVLSNASCTTNCLAPMAKVLNDTFGIERGLMTTIHSYTNNQAVLDSPNKKDFRRGRAAAESMIPTTTGAAKAVGKVLPELNGKLDGLAVRVPTPNVSLTDLTTTLSRDVTVEEVNAALEAAANGAFSGVIQYQTDPIVSSDAAGNPHSCVFMPSETKAIGNMVKTMAWYDNEWAFSCRMLDVVDLIKG